MTFWEQFWHQIGITPGAAVGVAVASAAIYLSVTYLLRRNGQRWSADTGSSGLALMLLLGSLSARAILGNSPTIAGWVIGLGVILLLELGFQAARLSERHTSRQAVIVWANGTLDEAMLHRFHSTPSIFYSQLREKGVTTLDGLTAVVLEPSGKLSLIKPGTSAELLAGVADPKGLIPTA